VVTAEVSVISDEEKVAFYAAAERGTWHGASATRTRVLRGFGAHAEMLDQGYAERNAKLARDILAGGERHGA
jgi:hybrid polyketide synthase/nonribosomal peptide synthetase FtdB